MQQVLKQSNTLLVAEFHGLEARQQSLGINVNSCGFLVEVSLMASATERYGGAILAKDQT